MNKFIEDGVKAGYNFIVLEPQSSLNKAIVGFDKEHGRLVYEVDKLLVCFKDDSDMDAVEALEWFDYNVIDLTYMKNGPLFYDKNEKNYLTHREKRVKL